MLKLTLVMMMTDRGYQGPQEFRIRGFRFGAVHIQMFVFKDQMARESSGSTRIGDRPQEDTKSFWTVDGAGSAYSRSVAENG